MFHGFQVIWQTGSDIPTDSQHPVCEIAPTVLAHALQSLADGDCHGSRLRLAGRFSQLPNEAMRLLTALT